MSMQPPIRVVIVDDHAMLRKGLAIFLMSYADLSLVGEASDGEEALALCAVKQPDVILMDLMMPVMDGVTATRLIRHRYPQTQVIALTSFFEESLVKGMIESGAIGYLFKRASADELAKAIRSAKAGFSTFAPEVTQLLITPKQEPDSIFSALTPRELEVLTLLTQGMRNREVAEHLMISLSTVKSHIANIFTKLGLFSRTEAIALALKHHLVDADKVTHPH